jgi:HSP20 family protein
MNSGKASKGDIAVQKRRPGRMSAWPFEPYFDRIARGFTPRAFRSWPRLWTGEEWLPEVDVFERNGKIVVRADLPGMKREDIEVTVEGDLLTIKGRREEEKEVKEVDYYCCERSTGEFSRTMRLPEGVGVKAVEAKYEDGVLEVTVLRPAAAERKATNVPVK